MKTQGKIAVDAVICTVNEGNLWVYLNRREKAPFEGLSELPGGLLTDNESAEETLARKLADTTGVKDLNFWQFHTFTNPERDPRERTISIGFIAAVPWEKIANKECFCSLADLPKMAFDHKEIIYKASEYLKNNVGYSLVKSFIPRYFPLNELQAVFEVVGQKKMDNRNFRKAALASGEVRKVMKTQAKAAHRPAALYEFVNK